MKMKSNIRIDQELLQFHHNRKSMDPFVIQNQVLDVDIPGFGKHYSCLALKGPMERKPGSLVGDRGGQHDPCFWNRGGGRWFHTKRRGGQIGRQRERGLPKAPIKE
jgi:hypothetical protein